MIRNCIKNSIFSSLDYDIFRFEDFEIEENQRYGENIKISINEYYFYMSFDGDICKITYNPGSILTTESEELEMRRFEGSIHAKISNWLNRVSTDMMNPLQVRFVDQKIEDFKKELEIKLQEVDDSFFSREEAEELRSRLDRLEEIIVNGEEQENSMQAEIAKMQKEIEYLKATVATLNKKKWLKNALLKMWAWGQKPENKKLIEAGMDTVKTISQIDLNI